MQFACFGVVLIRREGLRAKHFTDLRQVEKTGQDAGTGYARVLRIKLKTIIKENYEQLLEKANEMLRRKFNILGQLCKMHLSGDVTISQ